MSYVHKILRHYADADKWITVHPNGRDKTGSPVLIGEHGEVKAGMGGKFNGRHISAVPSRGAHEQAGAQMVVDRARATRVAGPVPGFPEDGNLKKSLPPVFYANVKERMNRAGALPRAVWAKFGGDVRCVNANNISGKPSAKFSEVDKGIYFIAMRDALGGAFNAPYSTFFHESAHNIDWLAAGRVQGARFSRGYKDGLFEKTLRSEILPLIRSNGFIREFKKLPKRDAYVLSDAIDWAAYSEGIDSPARYGHGPKYWSRGTYKLPVEAFANLFSAMVTNHGAYRTARQYLPKTVKLFVEMMQELGK